MNRVLHYFKNIKFSPSVNRHIFEKGKKKYSGNNATLHKRTPIRKFSTTSNKQFHPIPPPNPTPDDPFWLIVITASGCELLNIIMNNKNK
jgi:hypothetical protein